MKYGLDVSIAGEYANPRLLADLAAEAEQAGWDGLHRSRSPRRPRRGLGRRDCGPSICG